MPHVLVSPRFPLPFLVHPSPLDLARRHRAGGRELGVILPHCTPRVGLTIEVVIVPPRVDPVTPLLSSPHQAQVALAFVLMLLTSTFGGSLGVAHSSVKSLCVETVHRGVPELGAASHRGSELYTGVRACMAVGPEAEEGAPLSHLRSLGTTIHERLRSPHFSEGARPLQLLFRSSQAVVRVHRPVALIAVNVVSAPIQSAVGPVHASSTSF